MNCCHTSGSRRLTKHPAQLLKHKPLNARWLNRQGEFAGRLPLNVIDEGNREALRIECGTSISANRLTRVMSELVEVYGKPRAIRLDNGPEMTSHQFTDWAHDNGIELLFIQPGKPNQNAFIERFNRSFRTEVLDAYLFNSVAEAQAAADEWLTDYNECRSHESLGNVPPLQYMPREFNGGSLH
jgi:putative transposase